MRLLLPIAALSFALFTAAGLGVAVAVTAAPGAMPKQAADQAPGLVQKTYGCHATCRLGYVPRFGITAWHRHVGPRCWPVRC